MTDSISQLVSTIKNGYLAGKSQVSLPYSGFKNRILQVLTETGYLKKAEICEANGKKNLTVMLKYSGKKPAIEEIRMISKPGLRVYRKVVENKEIKGGLGLCLISTPAGVMTNRQAKKRKLGGEIILEVY